MKIVLQRVKFAKVEVENKTIGEISKGLLIFFGAQKGDVEPDLDWFVNKILKLRIFEDETGKMNKSVLDIEGEILVISQFTLLADCKKGTRPSFDMALEPKSAEFLYEKFIEKLKISGLKIEHGKFGAHMEVSLLNDGPVTIIL